jgi:bisphosphoglycerate-dependent phosphoglycerate mutase
MESPILMLGDRLVSWIDVPITKKRIVEAFDCTIKLENIELDFAFALKIILTQGTLSFICPSRKKPKFLYIKKWVIKVG